MIFFIIPVHPDKLQLAFSLPPPISQKLKHLCYEKEKDHCEANIIFYNAELCVVGIVIEYCKPGAKN